MKKVAVLQSNYIPWKGYFDLINMVDEFILFDDVQYTKRDWRNRNRIKTLQGLKWLTIPVDVKGKYLQKINEVKVSDTKWVQNHWQQIVRNYSKARCFKEYGVFFEELYSTCDNEYLSEINYKFIQLICKILNINTKIRFSSEFILEEGRTNKLLQICKQCNAEVYLSGPSAKSYFDIELARKENIKIEWMDYNGYGEYQQLYSPFEHGVTILDLIFNMGAESTKYMKSFNDTF